MSWVQNYEIVACAALGICCIVCNVKLRRSLWVTRLSLAMLGASAIVRGAALLAAYNGTESLSNAVVRATGANIELMAAIVIGSIAWQKIQLRLKLSKHEKMGHSSDAR